MVPPRSERDKAHGIESAVTKPKPSRPGAAADALTAKFSGMPAHPRAKCQTSPDQANADQSAAECYPTFWSNGSTANGRY